MEEIEAMVDDPLLSKDPALSWYSDFFSGKPRFETYEPESLPDFLYWQEASKRSINEFKNLAAEIGDNPEITTHFYNRQRPRVPEVDDWLLRDSAWNAKVPTSPEEYYLRFARNFLQQAEERILDEERAGRSGLKVSSWMSTQCQEAEKYARRLQRMIDEDAKSAQGLMEQEGVSGNDATEKDTTNKIFEFQENE